MELCHEQNQSLKYLNSIRVIDNIIRYILNRVEATSYLQCLDSKINQHAHDATTSYLGLYIQLAYPLYQQTPIINREANTEPVASSFRYLAMGKI